MCYLDNWWNPDSLEWSNCKFSSPLCFSKLGPLGKWPSLQNGTGAIPAWPWVAVFSFLTTRKVIWIIHSHSSTRTTGHTPSDTIKPVSQRPWLFSLLLKATPRLSCMACNILLAELWVCVTEKQLLISSVQGQCCLFIQASHKSRAGIPPSPMGWKEGNKALLL